MQNTVAQIGKIYETTAYFGYHTLATPDLAIDRAGRPTLLSQGGIDVARYLTGAQQGWSVIGRLMSVTDGRVADGRSDTAATGTATLNQLAVGIRYKPMATANLNVSAERIFQLGSDFRSSWLLRAQYSSERGAEINADRIPQLLVYNKIDLTASEPRIERDEYGRIAAVWISAKSGTGLDLVRLALEEHAHAARRHPTARHAAA